MNHSLRTHLIVILIILLIGVFLFSTVRNGHLWGDDFSVYIQHGISARELMLKE